MNLEATEEQMRTMCDQVKLLYNEKKSWLSDEEFLEIAKGVLGN